ncbi:hypothetical protein DXC69_03735 [Paenibacillus polymyxa]|nr:hypothetical protein DXC69_03735 [Paenibacillus polymyxa]
MGVQALEHIDVSRGDSMDKAHKNEGNVVETYAFGNTSIKICDDYIVTDERVDLILQKFHEVGWKIILSKEEP